MCDFGAVLQNYHEYIMCPLTMKHNATRPHTLAVMDETPSLINNYFTIT